MRAIPICGHKCIGSLALLGSNMPVSLVPAWMNSKGYYFSAQTLQPHWAAGLPCMDVQCCDIHERCCELQMEVLTEGQKAG